VNFPLSQDRRIRVFISSTFRDMQEERDILIKKIFPQLRKLCEERSVTWTEVDLRWGITTEQAAEGKVLPLCLAEIRRCADSSIDAMAVHDA
jgi:preprotein translocase subunit SecA/nephrocystin-3